MAGGRNSSTEQGPAPARSRRRTKASAAPRATQGSRSPVAEAKPTGRRKAVAGKGRALVTGASTGIGAELARVLAAEGHDLVLVARSRDKLADLAAELTQGFGIDVRVHPWDLTAHQASARLADELDAAGLEVDILVNNAGVIEVGPFQAMEPAALGRLTDLNIGALTALTRLILPAMAARGRGRVLNVASVAAFQPVPSMAVYAATKAYVLSFTEALSEEMRGTGVTLTALCPGLTDTNMMADIKSGSATARGIPGLLVSDPADVAREGYAAMMAGEVIRVPGLGNRLATGWSRVAPRWLVRYLAGFASRQADWMKGG